ncbi:hypothetical protein HG535_0C05950 [Zygotorulaspora mrakii]|uniref:RRM domain-containing protein n=1 Tax=Zygotorulaspora mrakii TaxID=42260 RepID=A0A7H9B0T3_ZYGMR|nr:uncharacterized protein HG535_0C05950 [Zygotorulaspora mrakii]QLG72241.1 hypothetical protein HG535_0C05950 [Zygotorulaspora mrakii]
MAPPKKTVKMDLNSFLNDDTFGSSWAEEDVDLNKITIPIDNLKANTIPLEELAAKKNASGFSKFGGSSSGGSRLDPALGGSGRHDFSDRVEYPVPDRAPYRAIINNIPWDISPEGVQAWVEDGLHEPDSVVEVDLPRSMKDPTRLKGIAFVTLKEREGLVKTLTFNGTKLNERTVYVSVAAPRREGFGGSGGDFDWNGARGSNYQASGDAGPDLDWGSARGSQFQERGPRREEVDLDWGDVRGSQFQESRPRREEPNLNWGEARGSQFQERGPRREEVDLDWSDVRGSQFQESKPRREEPNLNWGDARGSQFQERKPRGEEPNLDWGSARGSQFQGRPEFKERKPRKDGPQLDWAGARGAQFQDREKRRPRAEKTRSTEVAAETPKIQRSAFDVLSSQDDDEDDKETDTPVKKEDDSVTKLSQDTANLDVQDKDEWETVGKK